MNGELWICNLFIYFRRHCSCHVLINGSYTGIWKEKERSRIRAVQMDNLTCLLGIRRMDKVLITKLCDVTK